LEAIRFHTCLTKYGAVCDRFAGHALLVIMSPRSVLVSALALGLAITTSGRAQERRGATTGQTPDVMPVPTGGPNGPAAEADKSETKPVTPAAGYAYADKPAAASHASPRRGKYRATGPVVNLPGFETTPEGGSRFFVQLSQNVPVEERKAQGSVTYVLKGASPRVWNNTNALVTVHFNTPVQSARLVPQGQDLLFVVELRAAATPTWKMTDGPDKTAMLSVDFPKGEWLGAPAAAPAATPETGTESPATETPAPPPRRAPARKPRRAAPR
jgi:hypothetical protein